MAQPATRRVEADDGLSKDGSRAYRRALGSFATGVTVVTCAGPDGRPVGLTVSSFASVSLEPPLVSWCLGRHALSFAAFAQASHFAVNVLAEGQLPLVHHFAQRSLDKFDAIATSPGAGGAPLLEGTAARFECRRAAQFPGGDHVLLLGEVERYAHFEREPLVHVRGRFGICRDA